MATAEVRSYLERHKINKLFEDLMSNIVKDQPQDPVAFLITVLRNKQGKKSPSSRLVTPTVSSTLKGRGGLQVTGAAVEASKHPTGSRLTKSSADVRPSSASAPRRTPLASASTPNVTSRPATSVGREGATKSPRKSPGQAKIPVKTTTTRAQPPVQPSGRSSHSASKTRETGLQKKTAEKSTRKQAGSKPDVGKPPPTPTRQCSILDETPSLPCSPRRDVIDEFFGEKPGYGEDVNTSEDDDEDVFLDHTAQSGQREGSGLGISLDGADDEVMSAYQKYRQLKQCHHGNKPHLMQLLGDKMADTVQGAADSSGYNSSGEEESEDSEGTSLELYECSGDLLEEGIECSAPSHTVHRTAIKPNQGDVLIKVAICAKCARTISAGDEESSGVTSHSTANPSAQEELFESASQVGSNVSYPQWDLEGGPKMSLVRMWGSAARGSDQSDDGSTVVSRQTADSWGGLAPPHRSMPYPPSETGSESTVTAPLEGTPWGKTATEGTLAQRWATK